MVVKAGTIVSDLDSAQVCAAQNEATPSVQGPGSTLFGMADTVDKSVSDEDRRRLASLLTEFSTLSLRMRITWAGQTSLLMQSTLQTASPCANYYENINPHIWSLYKNTSPICFSKM